jgi:hypothetical protein
MMHKNRDSGKTEKTVLWNISLFYFKWFGIRYRFLGKSPMTLNFYQGILARFPKENSA